jgi:hypothetical protein
MGRTAGERNLDDVYPGLRQKYTNQTVRIELPLLEQMRAIRDDDDIRDTLADMLKDQFQEYGSSVVYLEFDDDGQQKQCQLFIDDEVDDNDEKYYIIKQGKLHPV